MLLAWQALAALLAVRPMASAEQLKAPSDCPCLLMQVLKRSGTEQEKRYARRIEKV